MGRAEAFPLHSAPRHPSRVIAAGFHCAARFQGSVSPRRVIMARGSDGAQPMARDLRPRSPVRRGVASKGGMSGAGVAISRV